MLIAQHVVSGGDLFELLLRLPAGPIRMILHRQLVVRLLDRLIISVLTDAECRVVVFAWVKFRH